MPNLTFTSDWECVTHIHKPFSEDFDGLQSYAETHLNPLKKEKAQVSNTRARHIILCAPPPTALKTCDHLFFQKIKN